MSAFINLRTCFQLLSKSEKERRQLPAAKRDVNPAVPTNTSESYKPRRADLQILQEFRNKMKQAEEMISKLAFSLGEIQDIWRKPKAQEPTKPVTSDVLSLPGVAPKREDSAQR